MNKSLLIFAIILAVLILAAGIFWGFSQKTIFLREEITQKENQREPAVEDEPEEENAQEIDPAKRDQNNYAKNPEKKESEENKKEENGDQSGAIARLMKSGFAVAGKRSIDTAVIHASYDALGDNPHSVEGVIREYEMYGVSAHYLIDRSGRVYQLVKDNNIAWHAGASIMPDGRTNVNQFSIGIELLYTKKEEPNSDQYESLKKLIAGLKEKYSIKNIVGHNQIAPARKDDPWNFDWSRVDE